MTLPPPAPPVYGLSFHPEALTDLRALPRPVQDLALARIEDVVQARITGGKLVDELADYRKLYLGEQSEWRAVYRLRPAPPGATHPTDVHLVAVRPRARHDIYDTVRARENRPRIAIGPRAHAARTLPPQMKDRLQPPPAHGPAPAEPSPPQAGPITTPAQKGPRR
ncbi:type II toxin-antitoxin system RelE/ParE family toxin [Streptomyces sp. NPDC058861]|uniref:type II toxin-antitoxin system RelE family toxin n=1 Tax=Streptomyces sp. NPDC058861 TaxID=3346653 RepID=UPI0036B6052A